MGNLFKIAAKLFEDAAFVLNETPTTLGVKLGGRRDSWHKWRLINSIPKHFAMSLYYTRLKSEFSFPNLVPEYSNENFARAIHCLRLQFAINLANKAIVDMAKLDRTVQDSQAHPELILQRWVESFYNKSEDKQD